MFNEGGFMTFLQFLGYYILADVVITIIVIGICFIFKKPLYYRIMLNLRSLINTALNFKTKEEREEEEEEKCCYNCGDDCSICAECDCDTEEDDCELKAECDCDTEEDDCELTPEMKKNLDDIFGLK